MSVSQTRGGHLVEFDLNEQKENELIIRMLLIVVTHLEE